MEFPMLAFGETMYRPESIFRALMARLFRDNCSADTQTRMEHIRARILGIPNLV